MYDAIVIGARCAGSPTALLLAQKGYRVLLVDRANFPSDTISTHQVQVPGGAALQRWGLLEPVLRSNCPPALRVSFQSGETSFSGNLPPIEGVAAIHSPRRTILDKILVDAAAGAGAELREDVLVEELIFDEGRVMGIRGHTKPGSPGGEKQFAEQARLVIGADGKHSLVAKAVQAAEYHAKPVLTCAYYTYWEGVPMKGGEMVTLPGAAVGAWPTNDGLTMIYTAYPVQQFETIRGDIEGQFWRTLKRIPNLFERLKAGRQAERFYGSADLPTFYRTPYGPGWALVGDAGLTMDPISGQGIGNAFLDAERVARAIDAGFSGRQPLETALAEAQRRRDQLTLPTYEFTSQLAGFEPPSVETRALFAALAKKPEAADRFFGMLTGSVPVAEFFAPSNLFRILGPVGMGRMMLGRLTAAKQPQPTA